MCIFRFSKKHHLVCFLSLLNYGDIGSVLIKHLQIVIPLSYPCHYTNLCPHKPHKPAHNTHTHTHTHTPVERLGLTAVLLCGHFQEFGQTLSHRKYRREHRKCHLHISEQNAPAGPRSEICCAATQRKWIQALPVTSKKEISSTCFLLQQVKMVHVIT